MKLSIIIPAYNAERFISNTLENLITQINKDALPCEIIVVNDGSSDNTQTICDSFCRIYSFVRLINQENKGESGARNTGIENSTGDYLYFLDCDDSLKNDSLKHFIDTIDANNGLDLYCFAYLSTANGKEKQIFSNAKLDALSFNREEFLKNYLAKYLPIHVCSCVVNKKLIEKYRLRFSLGVKIGADIEWLLNIGSVLDSAYFSNRICYVYQIRNDSIMQGYRTYSMAQYHSFEIRRDIVLSKKYQTMELAEFSNFWIENQLLSNIVYYFKSKFKDKTITENLCNDLELLKLPISDGNKKNKIAIKIARVLPLKFILRKLK